MPRPKGSKNKKAILTIEEINQRMVEAEAEVDRLSGELKAKKAELKELAKMKDEAERIEAERKAAEVREKIMAAVENSGKSVEEILELLQRG